MVDKNPFPIGTRVVARDSMEYSKSFWGKEGVVILDETVDDQRVNVLFDVPIATDYRKSREWRFKFSHLDYITPPLDTIEKIEEFLHRG